MSRRSWVAALLAVALVGATACSSGGKPAPEVLHPDWSEVTLPVPAGPAGRVVVRDAAACGTTWYVVGAVASPDGSTRPAAWSSSDGRAWRTIPIVAHQYYAKRAILYSVACHGDALAVLGAKSGGAHGNPRVTAWHRAGDGSLRDAPVPFEIFGGPNAIAVSRIAGGAGGWTIAGGRTSGAAVWRSPDATSYRLIDDDPQLSSDTSRQTNAWDVTADGESAGWTAVGYAEVYGRLSPEPLAWNSTDGVHWQRQKVPPSTLGFADLERVVHAGDRMVAVGIRDKRFGSWERVGGTWRAAASFGRLDPGRSSAPSVTGLAVGPTQALATVSDGVHAGLWARDAQGHWRPVAMPTRPLASGDRLTTVAAGDSGALLLSDDGTSGRVWLTTWNTLRP